MEITEEDKKFYARMVERLQTEASATEQEARVLSLFATAVAIAWRDLRKEAR